MAPGDVPTGAAASGPAQRAGADAVDEVLDRGFGRTCRHHEETRAGYSIPLADPPAKALLAR
jgi:hypothetical protein